MMVSRLQRAHVMNCQCTMLGCCLYICIYISRNMGGQSLRTPTRRYPGTGGYLFLILAAFLWTKRSGRVLRAMGRSKQVRTQQSRASGAVNLSRYGRFCCPGGSPGVPGRSPKGPWVSPRGAWEASGARGRSVRSQGSVSWARRYFFSSFKMSQNVKIR